MPIYILTDHNNDKNIHCLRKTKSGRVKPYQIINNALYTEKEWQSFIFNGEQPQRQTVITEYKDVGFIFGVRRLVHTWKP